MLLTASPVKELAAAHGIRVEQPQNLKDPSAQAMLAQLDCDLMVVAAYGLILPQAVLDLPRLGCINIHASLLPRWRGAAPIVRAIEHGDTQTGICIMRMEAGLDTGPVYSTHQLPIGPGVSAAALHDELARIGGVALLEALPAIAQGDLVPLPQRLDGVTYASKITKNEAPLDWSQKTQALVNKIRAFDPFPGATALWRGEILKIWSANIWAGDFGASKVGTSKAGVSKVDAGTTQGADLPVLSSAMLSQPLPNGPTLNLPIPGAVLACTNDSFVIATGDGAIEVTSIQKAGAKRISGKAMRQASPIMVGDFFSPLIDFEVRNLELQNLELQNLELRKLEPKKLND